MSSTDTTAVCVAIFSDLQSAAIAAGMLEAHGIRTSITNDIFSSVYPIAFALGGIRLLVAPSDSEEALQLLAEHDDIDHR